MNPIATAAASDFAYRNRVAVQTADGSRYVGRVSSGRIGTLVLEGTASGDVVLDRDDIVAFAVIGR